MQPLNLILILKVLNENKCIFDSNNKILINNNLNAYQKKFLSIDA